MNSRNPPELRRGWRNLLTILILAHLGAIGVNALAAPSGPWGGPDGSRSMFTPPQFAFDMQKVVGSYLWCTKMTHHYHLMSNRPGLPGVAFEARLRDAQGGEIKTIRIPEPTANIWVRHRQSNMARLLADDQPFIPPLTELVAAPHSTLPTVTIWEPDANRQLNLKTVPIHLAPRDRAIFRPSNWSMIMASSYSRFLARHHNAASVEIIRTTKEPIPPSILFMERPPTGAFDPLVSNFGRFAK